MAADPRDHKLKILIYSDCYIFGGAETIIANIMNSPLRMEYNFVFAFRANREYARGAKTKITGGIPLEPVRLLSRDSIIYHLGRHGWPRFAMSGLGKIFSILALFQLHRLYNIVRLYCLVRKERPTIVHINNGGYPGADTCRMAVIAARLFGVRSICFTINNLSVVLRRPLETWINRFIVRNVKAFTTASVSAARHFSLMYGVPVHKTRGLLNTLGIRERNRESSVSKTPGAIFIKRIDNCIIGSVGHLTSRKGYHVLLRAVAENASFFRANRMQVCVIGDGEERTALERYCQEAGVGDLVSLPGFRDNAIEIMEQFDVFVLPSISQEDFPNVILEAMFLGKPIVGTNVAGIPEQIWEGKNGFVVEPNDSVALFNALKRLRMDSSQIRSMGRASRRLYDQEFRFELFWQRYKEVYDTLIESEFHSVPIGE